MEQWTELKMALLLEERGMDGERDGVMDFPFTTTYLPKIRLFVETLSSCGLIMLQYD